MALNHGGFGSMILDIDGLRLDARYLTEEGDVRDYFTIDKSALADDVRPTLTLRHAGNQATISWPTSLRPYQLESTEYPEVQESWRAVPGMPVRVGRRDSVTIDPARTRELFRLKAVP
jgi:hypothetical protein